MPLRGRRKDEVADFFAQQMDEGVDRKTLLRNGRRKFRNSGSWFTILAMLIRLWLEYKRNDEDDEDDEDE